MVLRNNMTDEITTEAGENETDGTNPPPPEATAGEAVLEPAPVQPEPVITPPTPEPAVEPTPEATQTEPAPTAQPVEPLGPELQTAPEPPTQTSESPQEPTENQVSPEPQVEPVSSETSQPAESVPASAEGSSVATPEPVSEPVPQPEQETVSEPISQPESRLEPAGPQVNPVSNPVGQADGTGGTGLQPVIASTSLVSRARELLVKARETIQFRKRKKLEKIMSLFLKKQSITNDDVQMLVYVSDATATRYLNQLEREGRIRRENAGKYLSYSRV